MGARNKRAPSRSQPSFSRLERRTARNSSNASSQFVVGSRRSRYMRVASISQLSSSRSRLPRSVSSHSKRTERESDFFSITRNCSSVFGNFLSSARRGPSVVLPPSMQKVSKRASQRFADQHYGQCGLFSSLSK